MRAQQREKLAAVWGCSAAAPLQGPRRTLVEPGPMVPPSAAILLTINGAEGDPDEISVFGVVADVDRVEVIPHEEWILVVIAAVEVPTDILT